ncbi:MAG: glycosyltransferase family 9 protein [Bacteroidota bacterium]
MATSLERTVRRGLLRLLRIGGPEQGLPKLRPEELRRVLLIRYDRLGDMVITTPFLSALKDLAPDVEIDILASPANKVLVDRDPRVHQVIVWENSAAGRLRAIRECRRRNYDAVFQLILGRTTLPALLARLLAPRGRLIGKSTTGHDFLMHHATPSAADGHFSDRTLSLLWEGLQLDAPLPNYPYALHIPESDRQSAESELARHDLLGRPFILLNISASASIRELTGEQNIELARGLAALGYPVGITGAPVARELVAEIAAAAGGYPLSFRSLLSAAAGMAHAKMVVTPDTGTVHVASAAGVPTVVMYWRMGHPGGWAPRGVPYRIVQAERGELLRDIDTADVVNAAADLLREIGQGTE